MQKLQWLPKETRDGLLEVCMHCNRLSMFVISDVWNVILEMLIQPRELARCIVREDESTAPDGSSFPNDLWESAVRRTVPNVLEWLDENMLRNPIRNPMIVANNRDEALMCLCCHTDIVYYITEIENNTIIRSYGDIVIGTIDPVSSMSFNDLRLAKKFDTYSSSCRKFRIIDDAPDIQESGTLTWYADANIFPIGAAHLNYVEGSFDISLPSKGGRGYAVSLSGDSDKPLEERPRVTHSQRGAQPLRRGPTSLRLLVAMVNTRLHEELIQGSFAYKNIRYGGGMCTSRYSDAQMSRVRDPSLPGVVGTRRTAADRRALVHSWIEQWNNHEYIGEGLVPRPPDELVIEEETIALSDEEQS